MCGRYYLTEPGGGRREVRPSQRAEVWCALGAALCTRAMEWGFPREHAGLVINARAESVREKRLFSESVLRRRCIILADGYYEWSRSREKAEFFRGDGGRLFMAGCYDLYDGRERFVILTTFANDSVAPVHGRMPLIFGKEEARRWILEPEAAAVLLNSRPAALEKRQEYEQQSFLFP